MSYLKLRIKHVYSVFTKNTGLSFRECIRPKIELFVILAFCYVIFFPPKNILLPLVLSHAFAYGIMGQLA